MQLIIIAYLFPIIGILGIALFVYLRQRNPSVYMFCLLSVTIAIWLLLQMLSSIQTTNQPALWLLRAGAALGSFYPVLFILFAYYFAYPGRRFKRSWAIALLAMAGFFATVSFLPDIIRSVQLSPASYGPSAQTGWLYTLQTIYVAGGLMIGLALLINSLRRVSRARQISTYFMLGAFAIPLITNLLVGYFFLDSPKLQLLGPLSLFVMEGIMAYTMIKHGLFNLRGFVVRAAVYTVLVAAITGVYIGLIFNLGTNTLRQLGLQTYIEPLYVIATFIIALSFNPLQRFFNRFTNKIFFQDYYESQEVLNRFGNMIVSTIEQTKLIEGTIDVLGQSIRPGTTRLMLLHEGEASFHGANDKASTAELERFLRKQRPAMILRDEIDGMDRYWKIARHLDENNIAVIVRLQTSRELIGFMLLGPKRSGSIYNTQDLGLLRVIADELAIALQNAFRFREIQNFNKTLQHKVDEATTELREKNRRLRALDVAKDEFISMASHQLRTPLTSVKGYISMVLDGDGGPLKPEQRRLLGEAYGSTQRMVYLIGDFLNVSRIRTGKFVVEPKPLRLTDLIKIEINQLATTAEDRGLTLTYTAPEHFPTLLLDEEKTRQVIMNFIDNAIYYTPPGGHIEVALTVTHAEIIFTVKDSGIGVPKAEQHKLFSKFYRATNAKQMRPDGTGIGLFLAKKVIALQGGSIIFESKAGRGSVFGFRFPRRNALPDNLIDHPAHQERGKH